ncbi:MAG TPA: galactose oxidase-like domain-containing protein, partial [Dongiaceae bacterium]|nr:galactose oxidase-like domain-containing protein [Dongiaceae bacterium]
MMKLKSAARRGNGRLSLLAILFCCLPVMPVQGLVVTPESWVALPQVADPLLTNLSIPADAAVKGVWSGVYNWPMNGLHAALLPDGRVLTFGTTPNGNGQNGRYFDVWNPALGMGTNAHNTVYDPSRQDSFCGTSTYLPDGSLLLAGGNDSAASTIYDPSSHSSYTATATLAAARWYSTMLTLPDGRPLILGGMVPYTEDMRNNPAQAIANGWPSMTPELYENGQWRSLFGAYSRLAFGPDYLRTSYPRAWVAPDGRVFGISAEQMWYLDADANGGNGAVTSAGPFKGPYSSSAPVNVGATNSAVMFAPGKILQVGGNGGFNGDALPGSNMATVIDINAGAPVLSEQPRMAFARRYPNATVLANGNVVISGGTTYGNNNTGQPASAVNTVEIWNSVTGTWTTGDSAARYRGYHSITTLLANGTVLSTGGGTPGPVTNLNAEIYYPPYLFESFNGTSRLAQRPVLAAISGLSHVHGAELQVDLTTEDPIAQLALIGLSNGTHSFNGGQRRIPLAFTQQQFRLTATLPNSATAPPGYYQVVALGANGAPSVGAIIGIGPDQVAPPVVVSPYTPPTLEEPIATPVIGPGEPVSYSITPEPGTTYRWHFSDTDTATEYSENADVT